MMKANRSERPTYKVGDTFMRRYRGRIFMWTVIRDNRSTYMIFGKDAQGICFLKRMCKLKGYIA